MTYNIKFSGRTVVTLLAVALLSGGLFVLVRMDLAQKAIPLTSSDSIIHSIPQTVSSDNTNDLVLGTPSHLSLERIGIDLAVKPGLYNTQAHTWTLNNQDAFSMKGSQTPLIYGHDRASVFKNLSTIAYGDKLKIVDDTGKQYLFSYQRNFNVAPSDSKFLSVPYKNTLLLLTCSGPKFESRNVLVFKYIPETSQLGLL